MSSGASHDTPFTRAAQQVLEHLSATTGLGTWAVCRFGPHGSHTLAVVDAVGVIHANTTLTEPLGQGARVRIAAPVTFPDGQPFGELIGFDRRKPMIPIDQSSAQVRAFATLLGALAAADADITRAHSVQESASADANQTAALLDAMERGTIKPYFQPVVDLRTGEVVTLEALARWQSPEGVREPDQFLPLLQQAGLLGALFDRILEDGLQKLVEFRAVSPNLQLAVNFEFDTKPVNSLLDTVRDRLNAYGLPPEALSLELSERQTFELPADVRDELFAIADMGVHLMLDDFGTGFASLETLTSLPVTGVKLDRRFTGQVLNGERESIVVKAMIALAAETGLTVIAEGIETQLQCDRLVRMGCRLGQGYLFALPQPAEAVAAVLSAPLVSTF
ncbi:MAG: EAL domain-containing protein [Ilumatobacteraceae bacterium]|nr:EAL domain-containing protein [Ilumatobacteraceae bacterium]